MAMISTAAPGEPDAPSWFYVTPPEPGWPADEVAQWLEVFSATTLPGIAVHEVAPGHFSHGRALRRASGPVRRTLHSAAFLEGWAHYAEELCVEEGFRGDDPRFAIGVWLEALVRVTRLACAIGVHTAGMTVAGGRPPVRRGHPPDRPGRAVRGPPGHLRPDLRPVHLGQAADPGPARAGPQAVGRRVQPAPLPHRAAQPGLPAARPARHRPGPRLTGRGASNGCGGGWEMTTAVISLASSAVGHIPCRPASGTEPAAHPPPVATPSCRTSAEWARASKNYGSQHPGQDRGRSLIPLASRPVTSAIRAARRSGRRFVASM